MTDLLKEKTGKFRTLDRTALKYIAIAAMLLDHMTHAFIPETSAFFVPFRMLARITAPLMCYFIVEGYFHTRNVKKYAGRLFLFSLVSWLPYTYFASGQWAPFAWIPGEAEAGCSFLYLPFADRTFVIYDVSMIGTLFVGLLLVWMWDAGKLHPIFKTLVTLAACVLVAPFDWCMWGLLLCLVFYFFRDRPLAVWLAYSAVALSYIFNVPNIVNLFTLQFDAPGFNLYRVGMFLVPPLLIFFYNGCPGSRKPFHKWFFYVFYPAHLLVIDLIILLTA